MCLRGRHASEFQLAHCAFLCAVKRKTSFRWQFGAGHDHGVEINVNVVPNWFGAAIPNGIQDFSKANIFFQPTPSQAGYKDTDYPTNAGMCRSFLLHGTAWISTGRRHTQRDHHHAVPDKRGDGYGLSSSRIGSTGRRYPDDRAFGA